MAEEVSLRTIVDQLRSEADLGPGETLLHQAVKMQHERKQDVVKYLIQSGDVDCDQRDESGLTACELALVRLVDHELAAVMITAEFAGVTVERRFYVLIRRGSVEVFKLFLELNNFDEVDLFQLVSNAMIELNVKRVEIKAQMQLFLQFRLAKYAHEELAGDWGGHRNPNEWRQHFATIEEHWNVLRTRCDVRSYDGIDNEFLHRVQEIHNCLYFVKDKKFLRHLPMFEIVFCLGIFVSIFKYDHKYEMFKYLINKRNTMKFMKVICRQLKVTVKALDGLKRLLKEELEREVSKDRLIANWNSRNSSWKLKEQVFNRLMSGLKEKQPLLVIIDNVIASETFELPTKINGSDRSVLRNLRRCYFKTRQLYSIQKSLYYIDIINNISKHSVLDLIHVPAMKRVIQVIGEAIKSTKSSPHISKKVESTLERMLSDFFVTINKYFREYFSHKYSWAKKLLSESIDIVLVRSLVLLTGYVQIIYSITYICTLVEASRSLLGTMKSCRSVDQLKSLLGYVSDLTIIERVQTQHLDRVKKFYTQMSKVLTSVKAGSPQDLAYLKQHFDQKDNTLNFLKYCMVTEWCFSLEDIKFACEANTDISVIQHQIEWNLSFTGQHNIFKVIRQHWRGIIVGSSLLDLNNTTALWNKDPMAIVGALSIFEGKMNAIRKDEYTKETRKILHELKILEFSTEQFNAFHRQLLKYYENIFRVDNKFRVIRQFFKSQQWNVNEKILRTMRNKDEKMLQAIFDGNLDEMRAILRAEGISNSEELIVGTQQIPAHAMIALEYYQLELCEILIAVGYFGDNFHLLKHQIPLIHGRNYRNYLAHDSLSYNILTDSSRIVVLINAIVMADCRIDLFRSKTKTIVHKFEFPDSKLKLKWIDQQTVLFRGLEKMEYEEILNSVQNGGDLLGKLFQSTGRRQFISSYPTGLNLIDPNRAGDDLKTLCISKFPKICNEIWGDSYRSRFALQRGDYEFAFNLLTKDKPVKNSALPQDLFSWELIIDYLLIEIEDWNETDHYGRSILHRLILAGNTEGFLLLMAIFPDVNINVNANDVNGLTPLDYALKLGNITAAEALLSKSVLISIHSQKLVIMNHLNHLLDQLLLNFDHDTLIDQVYIQTAVRANNLYAVQYLVKRFYYGSHDYLQSKLPACLAAAAKYNHSTIVETLVGLPSVDYTPIERNGPNGNTALIYAVHRRNWTIVKLLLNHGSSPNWIHPFLPQQWFRTAFQLAVNLNSVKIVRLMAALVDVNNSSLLHPITIAIEKDSMKMVLSLQKCGFDLLDSSQILQAAMRQEKTKFFNLIMQKIDASTSEWRSDNVLDEIGVLLNHCRLITYLEEPNQDRFTMLTRAHVESKLNLLAELLNKYKEILKLSHKFVGNIKTFENLQLTTSLDCTNILKATTRMRICEKLIKHVREFSKLQSINSPIQFTVGTKIVNCNLWRFYRDVLDPTVDFGNHIVVENETENIMQQTFLLLTQLLGNSASLACGVLEEPSSSSRVYFLICEGTSYLIETTDVDERRRIANLVNFGDHTGNTSLHLASTSKQHLEVIDLLLEHGANPLALNSVQQTPLHLAIMGQDSGNAVRLLKHCIMHNIRSSDGISALELPCDLGMRPIHLAAMFGNLQAVQILINHGVDAIVQDTIGFNAAMYAMVNCHTTIVSLLLVRYPETINIQDIQGHSLLHQSTVHHNLEALELILQYDVDLFLLDNDGLNALDFAVLCENPGWLKTVLTYARSKGILELTKITDPKRLPLFHRATFRSKPDSLKAILEYEIGSELSECLPEESVRKIGNIITERSRQGFSPLYMAVNKRKERSVELILYCQRIYNQQMENKLNLAEEYITTEGCTLIDVALKSGHQPIINLLLKSIDCFNEENLK